MKRILGCQALARHKLILLIILLSLGSAAQAQEHASAMLSPGNLIRKLHFQHNVPLTMADGNAKQNSKIRTSELLCSGKLGRIIADCIRKVKPTHNSGTWITALYLKPMDESVASCDTWPLVPAQLVETTPTLTVTTEKGPRKISQIRKGDIVYCYASATQQSSPWRVGIVQRKARWVSTIHVLATEQGSYLPKNMIALNR